MGNVNTAQNRQLRSVEGAVGLRIRLLGPVAIAYDGKPVAIASKKARALIGYLALRQGTEISRDILTGLLWGERSEGQARASLRQTLSELRRSLPGSGRQAIIASKETVSWAAGSAWIDVTVLETAAGSEDDDALRDAAELIGGELMEGLSIGEVGFEQWLATERERFRLVAYSIYAQLLERAEQGGRVEEALTFGLKLLSRDPLQEDVHRTLMRLYAAQGRHDAALAQYERCRRELSNQLGVPPAPETEQLARSIRTSRRDGSSMLQPSLSPAPAPDQRTWSAVSARPSIAVLPFNNMSGDPEQEYFSDGITEDIITDLSKISALFVPSRHSVFAFKGKLLKMPQIARELDVGFVLEGSVRKAGGRVRIAAQLIDGRTGGHIWADRYDRDLTDIFAIQDEITHAIVEQLKVSLLPAEKKVIAQLPTANIEAYNYYLRGRRFLHRHSKSYLEMARRMFSRAVELDPLYARAYAGIADCDSLLLLHYHVDVAVESVLAISGKALELESGLAEAHTARGCVLFVSGRHDEGVAEFEQAIALDPNLFEAQFYYGGACFTAGKFERAASLFERAADIKPDDYQCLVFLIPVFRSLRREQDLVRVAREGLNRAERELTLRPDEARAAYLGAIALATLGEHERARESVSRALAIDPDDRVALYNIACVYAELGEIELALDALERMLPHASRFYKAWARHDSNFDPLRHHPRWRNVLKLME